MTRLTLRANEEQKALLGVFAVTFVENNTTIALGTGTTIKYFIEALAKKTRAQNLNIKVVSSSEKSRELAQSLGIVISDPDEVQRIDLMIDSADQISPDKELIKGGGGALLREKLLAIQAKTLIIIAHKEKLVNKFTFLLPVEIVPFCLNFTRQKIEELGVKTRIRMSSSGPFITDNQNYIIDIDYTIFSKPLRSLDNDLKKITGVVETGFFTNFNNRIFLSEGSLIEEI